MDDKFELPPRRELPEDIKDRMRATVRMRMDDPQFEPEGRGRRFLAAAAAILVVAVGAAVVVQSVQDDHAANDAKETTTSPNPTEGFQSGNQAMADRSLVDRCWRAAMASPQAERYPKRREEWMGGRQMNWGQVRQIGLRLGQQVAACELSETTVWLSEPQTPLAPDDPTPIRLMMLTPNGGSAVNVRDGVGKTVVGVDQSARGGTVAALEPFDVFYGVRVGEPRQLPGGAKVHVGTQKPGEQYRFNDVEYPNPQGPLVTVLDRPLPPAERTSVAGKKLAECITNERTKHFRPLVDAELLVPGAYTEYQGAAGKKQWAVTARYKDHITTCAWNSRTGDYRMGINFAFGVPEDTVNQVVSYSGQLPVDPGKRPADDGSDERHAGFTGAVSEQVAELSMTLHNGTPLRVTLKNGTFIAQLTGAPVTSQELDVPRATYVAKDATGKVIGSGRLYPE
ncbi:hypothetical protein N8J89_28505 [Crossiella sp. CA-258035]|uniref:hypothetical protein n=1 Tax=Crossiella sp. CA-258035 TaxID=2981138 RepID=UPI0024BD4F75|nr:hypothetical protein [Crossiella sp. CA-258035]WHT17053.1 hypothetical protein N8J89_28505 [Crossiella sp. CA-258035]